jgi:hypothetical protein
MSSAANSQTRPQAHFSNQTASVPARLDDRGRQMYFDMLGGWTPMTNSVAKPA